MTLALAGCGSSGGKATPTANPSPSTSVKIDFFRLGQRAASSKGTVVVHAYDPSVPSSDTVTPDPGDRFVAIDVEGCAGKHADENTGIEPAVFYLQIGRKTYYPVDPGVREPALHKTVLAPGRCARGWVTIEIPEGGKPQLAFYRGLTRIGWVLPR